WHILSSFFQFLQIHVLVSFCCAMHVSCTFLLAHLNHTRNINAVHRCVVLTITTSSSRYADCRFFGINLSCLLNFGKSPLALGSYHLSLAHEPLFLGRSTSTTAVPLIFLFAYPAVTLFSFCAQPSI